MRTPIGVTAVLVTVVLGLVSAQATDESAINERVTGLFAAVAKGDVAATVASYDENAVHAIGPNVVVGRANIEAAVREAFAHGEMPITFTRDATRLLSTTTAIIYGSYEVSGQTPSNGHVMLTLIKKDNDWLVAGVQLVVNTAVERN